MTTLQRIQSKIAEEMSDLYEAFFAAQESLEESEYLVSARKITKTLTPRSAGLANCGTNVSS